MICLVIGSLIAVVLASGGCSKRTAKDEPKLPFTCEVCGYSWEQQASATIECPKCKAAGVSKTSYVCPRCRKEFVGLLTQKLGAGKFQYRRPDDEEWTSVRPEKLKCPHCGYDSANIHAGRIRQTPGDDPRRRS